MGEDSQKVDVVVAVIMNSEGKILLQKRNDPNFPESHGKWEFPGGAVDDGESKEEALQRECREEIDCSVVIERALPKSQKRTWASTAGEQVPVEVYGYECRVAPGSVPKPSNIEVAEIGWFNKEDTQRLDTLPGIVDFLDQIYR